MKSAERHYRVDKQQIGYLRFILEGYEGIASLTTVDPMMGQILLRVPPGCDAEVDMLLADLAGEVYLETVNGTSKAAYIGKLDSTN